VTVEKRALYFGCQGANNPGHYLQEGPKIIWDVPVECGWWHLGLMDGGLLKNGKHCDIEDGRVWWTCGGREDLWYAFFWWDRSGDKRRASNSSFYVCGFAPASLSPETARENSRPAFEYACSVYPEVVGRQRHPLVLQDK
jgi:hypothetical protein